MKKILSLAACSAMVLGFAATASAVHIEAPAETSTVVAKGALVTIDGSIRFRGAAETKELLDDFDGTNSNYDGRIRLGVHAQASDAISGYMLLSSGNNHDDTYTWGEDHGLLGSLTNGGNMHSSVFDGGEGWAQMSDGGLSILEAWINYNPGVWGVKVGHMPLSLGNKLFFDHTQYGDDAIVAYMSPSEATHLGALTIKVAEDPIMSGLATDDLDAYVVFATQKISDALNLGANYTLLSVGSATANALTGVDSGANLSNLGLTVDGIIGGLSYGLDGEIQFGDALAPNGAGNDFQTAKGYALRGTASMDLGGMKVGALVGFGSGDDNSNDDDSKEFYNFLSDVYYDTLIVGYRQAVPGESTNSGLSNLLLVQLNGALATKCPLTGKDLNLKATGSYMKLNKEAVSGGDKDVGFELDLLADWQLGNGLVYGVEAGYLWAGDAYDSVPNRGDAANGYFLRHRLELKF